MTAIDRINEKYAEFSRAQKRIADYIMTNTERACFLTLKELAEETDTTEVTIINFSKKVDYRGFSDFKKDLQAYIQMVLSPSEKIVNAISSVKDKESKLMDIINIETDSLTRTVEGINGDDIKMAVELIKTANTVYVVGQGISGLIADFLHLRIRLLGLEVKKFDISSYNEISAQMISVKKDDLFIISSFPRYAKRSILLAEYLKERGNKIISLTDRNTSPVALNADVSFTCVSDTTLFYNSITAAVSLANLLVSALALDMEDVLLENRDDIKEIQDYFYDRIEIEKY